MRTILFDLFFFFSISKSATLYVSYNKWQQIQQKKEMKYILIHPNYFNVIHLIRDSLVFLVFTSFIFYTVVQAEVYLEEMFDQ